MEASIFKLVCFSFDNVRIPRENLLNKYSDVTEDGQFVSKIGSGRARFLTVADQLLSGNTRLSLVNALNTRP